MPPIQIHSATLSDAFRLAHISGLSFATDRNTLLKYGHDYPRAFTGGMREGIVSWMQSPRCEVLKATDTETGDTVGWVCWGRKGYPVEEEGAEVQTGTTTTDAETDLTPIVELSTQAQAAIKRLETFTSAGIQQAVSTLMPEGTKCRYIIAINIAPAYQSQGVGSALIHWGTSKADAEGVFCWVHASEAGVRAFRKAGFEEFERLEFSLDEYAAGRKSGFDEDGKWGSYTLTAMKREARGR